MNNYSMLGFNSTSTNLNNELITKLKDSETLSKIKPIETKITNFTNESLFIKDIQTNLNNLKNSISNINVSSNVNIFDVKKAITNGNSVTFTSTNDSLLKEETININVNKLAQKDVYQSNTFTNIYNVLPNGTLNINNQNFITDNKTYSDIVDEINNSNLNLNASLEQVSATDFRLVLKSNDTGIENSISITQSNIDLGFNDLNNHTSIAQNLDIDIDGVNYNVNSSSITLTNGLKLDSHSLGKTSISISNDESAMETSLQSFVSNYNTFIKSINDKIYSTNELSNKSSLESLKTNIKNLILNSKDGNSLFNNGFNLDKDGNLSLDYSKFKQQYNINKDSIKSLLIGDISNKGVFSNLNDILSFESSSNGLLSNYNDSLSKKISNLNLDKEKGLISLDKKYNDLGQKFSDYNSIISSFENSFSSLKLMIYNQNNN